MSLTANSSVESLKSARRKFFMNSATYIMSSTSCLEVGIKGFLAQEAAMSLTAYSSLKSARRKFFMNSTYIMSRKLESQVFLLRRPK